jgi:chromosome segregation and condensation protein ScpB
VSALSNRLKCAVHPGLPNPVTRVPFGQESRSKEEVGLLEAELQVVVAVVAADFTQVGPVSREDIDRIVACEATNYMARLERSGWVEVVGVLPRSTSKLYRATSKARRVLGLEGWSLLREVA